MRLKGILYPSCVYLHHTHTHTCAHAQSHTYLCTYICDTCGFPPSHLSAGRRPNSFTSVVFCSVGVTAPPPPHFFSPTPPLLPPPLTSFITFFSFTGFAQADWKTAWPAVECQVNRYYCSRENLQVLVTADSMNLS